MARVIFASSGDRPAAREVEPPATASQSRETKFSSSQMEPIGRVGNSLRETSTSLYILWPQEDDVRAESRMMAGRYLGATLWLPLALLVACVPNRKIAYPTAEATHCSPNDIRLGDIVSRTSDGEIIETYNAECLGNHYRCTRSKGVTNCQLITAEMARQASLPPAPSQPVIGSEITQTIFPLIQQVWTAHRGGDVIGEAGLLTEDYTSVHPDGSFHFGKATAQEMQGGPIGAFILSDVRIAETSPDAVLANYIATVEIPGAPKLSKFAVAELWVKRGPDWKRRYYQATPLP